VKHRGHGQGTVEEHPKGSGRFRVRGRLGNRIRTIASGLTRASAEEHRAAYAQRRVAEDLREGITLAHFGAGFLERRELLGSRSGPEDRNRWRTYVEADQLGGIPVSMLRRSDVVEWRDRLLTRRSRRGKKGLQRQTVKNALSLLKRALADALDRELCTSNVAADIEVPRGVGTHKLELEGILLPAEQTALLAAVPEHQRPAVLFALAMGVRWSEVSWLRWEDIRDDAVVIRRSRRGQATKGGKPRRLPLSPPARLALEAAKALRSQRNPWVFPGPKKHAPRKQAPSQWGKWVAEAGIKKHVRFHDLRHTTATSLIAGWWGEKWSLEEVRRQLGHASIQVTERYARLVDELLDQAVARTSFGLFSGLGGSSHVVPTLTAPADSTPAESLGASFEIRTRDLRFTNPYRPERSREVTAKATPPGNKSRERSLAPGSGYSPAAWSLALAAARLGLGEVAGA
jgi:integrase